MRANVRTLFILAAAVAVVGAFWLQQREISQMRVAIVELTALLNEEQPPAVAIPLTADIDELRRQAAEVHRLRDEGAQLRREKEEISELQASIGRIAQYPAVSR